MFNTKPSNMNYTETNYRKIGIVAAIAIALAAMMIPGASLASTALADKGGKVSDSGNVVQSISQSNSISASNSGAHGSASADLNTQSNEAANVASVDIHNGGSHDKKSGYDKGGSIKDSGNVVQSIDQSNSISASNSGASGSASADLNTQSNEAANIASVDIHNHGGYHGGKIKDSGNVVQAIGQSNSITATNTGNGGSASADLNTQSNEAANIASVDIHNHGGKIKDSGNVAQILAQANSINATNTALGGRASADFNIQSNNATNFADIDIRNH